VFRLWPELLPPCINVIAICYPGRDSRFAEPAYTSLEVLVPELSRSIRPWLDEPYAFFGHSMGAFVAHALSGALIRQRAPRPEYLFVSGAPAPHLVEKSPLHKLPSRELLRGILNLDGLPEEALRDSEMLRYVLRLLRADLEACETYLPQPVAPVVCPLAVFGGDRDPKVSVESLRAWGDHAGLSLAIEVLEGRHFFLHEQRENLLGRVTEHLRGCCA
jgi:surfactin synthase thioesterase subunit